jgi:hypothetical protein
VNYIIIREVATEEIRICKVPAGYKAPADEAYRWAGWFETEAGAIAALEEKCSQIRRQLYSNKARPIDGTPGPRSISELFRLDIGNRKAVRS